jgi:hypothetical protein
MQQIYTGGKFTPRLIGLEEYKPGQFMALDNDRDELKQEAIGWELEASILQAEQEQDLQSPVLSWWNPAPMTEAEYFNQLAQIHGKTEAVL